MSSLKLVDIDGQKIYDVVLDALVGVIYRTQAASLR
jgi:hypothetical protein